jgi:hypothetical protein
VQAEPPLVYDKPGIEMELSMSTEELNSLLARCALREEKALEILYTKTSSRLYALALANGNAPKKSCRMPSLRSGRRLTGSVPIKAAP